MELHNTLSNCLNEQVCFANYQFDPSFAAYLTFKQQQLDLPNVEQKAHNLQVTHRPRRRQTQDLLNRLENALIPCRRQDWLQRRKINNLTDIYSIDHNKLSRNDLLDLYVLPADHIIDLYGDKPIDGPVFLDRRQSKLIGVCVRNITTDLNYAAAAKYTFSNFGWFIWGYDDCSPNDEIYLVEGVFDALALKSQGYKALAFGSAYPTPFQLACVANRFKNLRVCFDDDFWGHYGAYMIHKCLGCHMVLPNGKDASCPFERGEPIQFREFQNVRPQLIGEIGEYNKLVNSGGSLTRALPYN